MKKGCSKMIFLPFDSEHPEKGGGTLMCGDGIICIDCVKPKDADHENDGVVE